MEIVGGGYEDWNKWIHPAPWVQSSRNPDKQIPTKPRWSTTDPEGPTTTHTRICQFWHPSFTLFHSIHWSSARSEHHQFISWMNWNCKEMHRTLTPHHLGSLIPYPYEFHNPLSCHNQKNIILTNNVWLSFKLTINNTKIDFQIIPIPLAHL